MYSINIYYRENQLHKIVQKKNTVSPNLFVFICVCICLLKNKNKSHYHMPSWYAFLHSCSVCIDMYIKWYVPFIHLNISRDLHGYCIQYRVCMWPITWKNKLYIYIKSITLIVLVPFLLWYYVSVYIKILWYVRYYTFHAILTAPSNNGLAPEATPNTRTQRTNTNVVSFVFCGTQRCCTFAYIFQH